MRYVGKYTEETFFGRSAKRNNGCMEWLGPKIGKGYGAAGGRKDGKRGVYLAHRRAWEYAHGPVPAGSHVLHHCDNPSCINPEHLFLGNNKDNCRDKVAKGRQPRGSEHGISKITENDVIDIRSLYVAGATQQALGDAYGLTQATVGHIVRRNTWKHVQ